MEEKKKMGSYEESDSAEYVEEMVVWYLTVFEGFFIRALTSDPTHRVSDEEARDLFGEVTEKATRIFLEKFKDCPVYLPSIFVLLERKQDDTGASRGLWAMLARWFTRAE